MILVVYGHTCTDFGIINQWICSFFMGLFFISGGYTYHRSKNWLKKNFRKIYLPYLIWGLVGVGYALVKAFASHTLQEIDILGKLYRMATGIAADNYPLWFLAAFFVSKTVYDAICAIVGSHMFDKFEHKRKTIEVVIVLAIAFAGYEYTLHKPFGHSILRFDTGLIMLPFFPIGRYLPILLKSLEKKKMMVMALLVSLFINIASGVILNDLVSVNSNEYGNIFLFFISTVSGSIAVFIVCTYLEKYKFLNKYLSHFGKYSLSLLCCHVFILIMIASLVINLTPVVNNYPILITALCLVVLYPILPTLDKMTKAIAEFILPIHEKNNNR